MANYRNVIWSQDITTSVERPFVPLFVSTKTLNTIIGQESTLFLPKIIGV